MDGARLITEEDKSILSWDWSNRAPELIRLKRAKTLNPPSYPVDWYSLGVLLYTLSEKKAPFYSSNRDAQIQSILNGFKPPTTWNAKDPQLIDLITRLLRLDTITRLGSSGKYKGSVQGTKDVQNHAFFKCITEYRNGSKNGWSILKSAKPEDIKKMCGAPSNKDSKEACCDPFAEVKKTHKV